MTSPLTANISQASSKLVQNQQPLPAQQQPVSGVAQIAQATQAQAQRSQGKVESNDKKRGVQTPKRTEASFSAQTNKAKAGPLASEEEREAGSSQQLPDAVDVVA